ncbi:MAG: folate-binding protein [Chromatiales bacterium]|nr:folate-binding protein [Chromatiales bacterium]
MGSEQNNWQNWLAQQGAVLQEGRVSRFGDAEAERKAAAEGNVMIPLPHLSLLRVSGTDALTFLQGQTSNDLRQVDAEHHQLNSYNTPKGRMLALFTLFMRDGAYYLQLPSELLEAVQKRLTMFVMRSDVKIEAIDDEMASLALAGPEAATVLRDAVGGCPESPDESLTVDGLTLLRRPGDIPRFVCVAPTDRLTALWQSLVTRATPCGADVWEWIEIRAGIPHISSRTVEAFVAQMLNLQLINGVNFKKGCYPGQEVVARMQYLGKLKRRMYRVAIATATPPADGSELYSPLSASGQGAGKVVRAALNAAGQVEALVVAEIGSAEADSLYLESETGPKLTRLELPYPFEPDD